jgi:transposase
LLAQVAVGKFSDYLPVYRLEDIFARAGMELSRSTLCRWARHTADLLEPLYALMVERVRRSHVIHTDDTPVPVLDPTLGHTAGSGSK